MEDGPRLRTENKTTHKYISSSSSSSLFAWQQLHTDAELNNSEKNHANKVLKEVRNL